MAVGSLLPTYICAATGGLQSLSFDAACIYVGLPHLSKNWSVAHLPTRRKCSIVCCIYARAIVGKRFASECFVHRGEGKAVEGLPQGSIQSVVPDISMVKFSKRLLFRMDQWGFSN